MCAEPPKPGKTTLINILTGLYNATEGEAILAGYKVGIEMEQVYRSIGTSCTLNSVLARAERAKGCVKLMMGGQTQPNPKLPHAQPERLTRNP